MNKKSIYKALPFVAILGALTSCSSIKAEPQIYFQSYSSKYGRSNRKEIEIMEKSRYEAALYPYGKSFEGKDYFEKHKKIQALLKEIELELAQAEKKRKKRENILIAAAGATIGLSVLGTAVLFGSQGREG